MITHQPHLTILGLTVVDSTITVYTGNTDPCKTVVLIGNARGGTSVFAGIIHHLGIRVTDDPGLTFEDLAINRCLVDDDLVTFKNIVKDYDLKYPAWGFKYWKTLNHIDKILPLIRNSHIINIFRDPVAITTRQHQMDGTNDRWATVNQYYYKQFKLVNMKRPQLLVSYDRLLKQPQRTVIEIRDFLKLSENVERETIAWGSVNV